MFVSIRLIPLSRLAMISAPTTEPAIVPSPPMSDVPPMTAAASIAIGGSYDPTDVKNIDRVYLGTDEDGKDMYIERVQALVDEWSECNCIASGVDCPCDHDRSIDPACAAEGMKHYRAICFVIGQMIGDAPGDCMNAPASAGLEEYIAHEFGIMDASRCS